QFAMLFHPLSVRDVARDLRCADDPSLIIAHRRNSQRNIHQASILALPHGLIMIDPFARSDAGQYAGFLIQTVRRYQDRHGLADNLFRFITENSPRTVVPTCDIAILVFAYDRVVRGIDNGSQPLRHAIRTLAIYSELGDV